jgi:hypothetical protein
MDYIQAQGLKKQMVPTIKQKGGLQNDKKKLNHDTIDCNSIVSTTYEGQKGTAILPKEITCEKLSFTTLFCTDMKLIINSININSLF